MQVAFNYNNWQFWSIYDTANDLYGNQKVVFDGPNKLIIVSEDVTELDFREDVYSAWKEWIKDPNQQNAQYEVALSATGGDPLPGDRALGTTYFLENGWRMRTWEGNHELTVTGNFFTREGVPAFVPTLNPWTITINLNTATLVETILPTIAIDETTVNGIATAVWNESLSNGSTAEETLVAIQQGLGGFDSDVWNYIIDNSKNQTAAEKLRKIATKTQDIALG
jgi:hypothetical protein